MVIIENECVGCPQGMGCLGSSCPNRHVPYFYCDKCGEDLDIDSMHGDPESETGHYCDKCWDEEEEEE